MYFFLSSQDLSSLECALIEQKHVLKSVRISTPPEGFLAAIDQQKTEWSISFEKLEGIIIVTGPGSFTSSRLSVTIANAIAYRYALPLIPLENPYHLSVEHLLESIDFSQQSNDAVRPTYNRPAHIS